MKVLKQSVSVLMAALMLNSVIHADDKDGQIDFSDFSSESIQTPGTKQSPFSGKTKIDVIQKAKIDKGFFKGDEVQFGEADVQLGSVIYYCEAYKAGAAAALSYTNTYIHWATNPWICQTNFYTATLNISGFSNRLERWLWRGQASINVDAEEWNLENYASYDFLLWGRYEQTEEIGLHVGLIVETGMLMDRVYPILGADWQISKKWKLNLILPVNVSIEYMLNSNWMLAVAGRCFNSRHRANRHEGQAKALVRYENIGAEFAVRYENRGLSANIHAGSTLGGKLRIADKQNHHPRRYKLNPAGYIGAEATLKF